MPEARSECTARPGVSRRSARQPARLHPATHESPRHPIDPDTGHKAPHPAAVIPAQVLLSIRLPMPSASQQRRLYRRCPRGQRRKLRLRCAGSAIQMRKDLCNDCRIFSARDHLQPSVAARASFDLDPEHPLQALRPTHRHRAWGCRVVGTPLGIGCRFLEVSFVVRESTPARGR
jgi:hypothetical protein